MEQEKRARQREEREAEEIAVVSSDEENPRRETEVDEEDERAVRFGAEQNEDLNLETEPPLHRPIPTDQPLDISPAQESDGEGLGLVDEPDEVTMAEYERGAEADRRDRRSA